MTYRENIERLRERGRYNLQQRKANARNRIGFINDETKEIVDNIGKATDLLVGEQFGSIDITSGKGGLIPFQYNERIKKKQEEGIEAEKLDRQDKVKRLNERLQQVSDTDTAGLKAKYELLINGYQYEATDRYTKLSPHAQVAYARRKLGIWKESVDSKLNYKLAKDNTEYTLAGWPNPLNAAAIHNDPLIPPIVKEAFVDKVLADLLEENGINGFSPELLELEQINDYVDQRTGEIKNGANSLAKKGVMDKYRTIFNVTSSQRQRLELFENFKSDKDLTKLLQGIAGTLDNDENLLGPLGAWTEVENLAVSWLMSGDINRAELKEIFKNSPSFQGQGKTYWDTHEKRYDNIIEEYGRQLHNRTVSELRTAEAQAETFKNETLIDLGKGGKLYNYLFEEVDIDNKTFPERAAILKKVLANVQTKYEELGGTKPEWIADLYNQLAFTDQPELVAKAFAKMEAGIPLRPQDIEGMNESSKAKVMGHRLYGPNQGLIQGQALAYQKVTPQGGAGSDFNISEAVKQSLKDNKLDHTNGDLIASIVPRARDVYLTEWNEAWLEPGMTGQKAYNRALGKMRWWLGLQNSAEGENQARPIDKIIEDLQYPAYQASTGEILESEIPLQKQAETLSTLLTNKLDTQGVKLNELAYYIPSLGPTSAEYRELVKVAEGVEGAQIPRIYHWIAHFMPNHNVKDIANWQLSQMGKTLPSNSAVDESMKFLDEINGFNRLIGFKTVPQDLHKAKIDAMDGKFFSGVPTYATANQSYSEQGLTFDKDGKPVWPSIEDNPNYMGNDLEGFLKKYMPSGEADDAGDITADISQAEQINTESNRLNDIYNEKGFHEDDPGDEPRLQDFPLQPGSRRYTTIVNGIPTLNPYDEDAWNAAVKDWNEKKSLYRPLTKEITSGGRSKTTKTVYFNAETDTYEDKDIGDRLFPTPKKTKKSGRELFQSIQIQKRLDARLERANALPDSKVVDIHRMPDGSYIQGPVTVYKHVDANGNVKWKIAPVGSESYLQSFWNIPGSPVLSPALQDYAMELYTTNLQTT